MMAAVLKRFLQVTKHTVIHIYGRRGRMGGEGSDRKRGQESGEGRIGGERRGEWRGEEWEERSGEGRD